MASVLKKSVSIPIPPGLFENCVYVLVVCSNGYLEEETRS